MIINTKFGLGEIVIREVHKNGEMIQDRMMEVITINSGIHKNNVANSYICEHINSGYRQHYDEGMLVGDPGYDQELGCYPQK